LREIIINFGYALLFLNLVLYLKVFFKQGKLLKFYVLSFGTVSNPVENIYDSQWEFFLSHFYFVGQFVLLSLFLKVYLKLVYKKQ
jgi:hypothetical protein